LRTAGEKSKKILLEKVTQRIADVLYMYEKKENHSLLKK